MVTFNEQILNGKPPFFVKCRIKHNTGLKLVNTIEIIVISPESETFLVWINTITHNVKSKFELKFQQSISQNKFDFLNKNICPSQNY